MFHYHIYLSINPMKARMRKGHAVCNNQTNLFFLLLMLLLSKN